MGFTLSGLRTGRLVGCGSERSASGCRRSHGSLPPAARFRVTDLLVDAGEGDPLVGVAAALALADIFPLRETLGAEAGASSVVVALSLARFRRPRVSA
jgi:hypothetical protein